MESIFIHGIRTLTIIFPSDADYRKKVSKRLFLYVPMNLVKMTHFFFASSYFPKHKICTSFFSSITFVCSRQYIIYGTKLLNKLRKFERSYGNKYINIVSYHFSVFSYCCRKNILVRFLLKDIFKCLMLLYLLYQCKISNSCLHWMNNISVSVSAEFLRLPLVYYYQHQIEQIIKTMSFESCR